MWTICTILALLAFRIVDSEDPFPRREWEVTQRYYRGDKSFYKKAIFPTIRECTKTEDILLVQLDIAAATQNPYAGPDMKVWSSFLNNYVFFSDESLKDDKDYSRVIKDFKNDPQYMSARFGIPILMSLMLLFTIAGFFGLPIIGLIVFHLCQFVWMGITSKPFRKCGRYIVIQTELMRRRRQRYMVPILVNKTVQRRFYRVPKFFREHTDEDEPEILRNFQGTIAVQIKDSSSDVSITKLYKEFYQHGEPVVRTDPNTGIPLTKEQQQRAGSISYLRRMSRADLSSPNEVKLREAEFEAQMREKLVFDKEMQRLKPDELPKEDDDLDNDYDGDDDDDDEPEPMQKDLGPGK